MRLAISTQPAAAPTLMPAIVLGGKFWDCWVVGDGAVTVVGGFGETGVVVLERRVRGADAMSPPARSVICGLE
jgi:hypothetical protein